MRSNIRSLPFSCRMLHSCIFLISGFAAGALAVSSPADETRSADVVVYGGTPAGISAAIQVRRMQHSVILIEPTRHVGGLTTSGLGATDIGNKGAIGGISREFYRRIGSWYQAESAWKFEQKDGYRGKRQSADESEMWTFEPHVATEVFNAMLAEAQVPVVLEQRLDLKGGVVHQNQQVTAVRMESGQIYQAKIFIDATYEGDLMAGAGVSFHVGRESGATYDETLNGVQVGQARFHQFSVPVDPFRTPGDPASGLLPGIESQLPPPDGTGDHRVQAYCFRLCTTDVPENRIAWVKPEGYDPEQYELLLRNFEAGDMRIPWAPTMMPNRKTDTNNNFAISIDAIGMSYTWPEADHQQRLQLLKEHTVYQQGLLWTLASSPRVPSSIRDVFQRWGLAADEFTDNNNWPWQIYVREARRMVSDHVMSQHDCQGRHVATDAVGLAAYTMDSHNVQRYVRDGRVWNEGDVQVGGFSPYPISYRSIRPKKSECRNLLVPTCLSASHIAFGSIRMEPVFMLLGQSAATAAVQSLEADCAVQDIDTDALQQRLLADGQVLKWTPPSKPKDNR